MEHAVPYSTRFHSCLKSCLHGFLVFFGLLLAASAGAGAQTDLSSQYVWQPVRIGGGGWVVGMVIHPLDPTVRFARTDVGSPYRWNNSSSEWIPMRVSNANGTGVRSAPETDAPSSYGVDSIAVDPTNTSVVYMVFPTEHSCDIQCPTNYVEIYKSVDGGINFTPGNMSAAAILGNPNGTNRMDGEKLVVDPANPAVLYYGSDSQGLWRSLDDGITWTQYPLSGSSAPLTNIEFVNIQFAKGPGTVTVSGAQVSKTIYGVSIQNSGDAGGDVYQSTDGGETWTDISTGITDPVSGKSLSHQALSSSIDATDALYVVENSATDGYLRAYWNFSAGKWIRVSLQGFINQALTGVVVDPTNVQRIYALGADTGLSRSDNGGATWINLGSPQYANTLGWLPQTVGMSGGEWHSNGGLKIDTSGNLWSPTGQEGIITTAAATASTATTANPPKWTIESTGIEEMVSMDMTVPPGSNDTIIAMAMDTTGFYIPNPDNFSAVQIPLQQEIISQGTTVAYSPDTPSYVVVTSSNVYTNGPNYSGYSTNGGLTWTRFSSAPTYNCSGGTCDIPAGMIAVSARGSRTLGSDHIVIYPPNDFAPQYSQDGGVTWHVTQSFPLNADGLTINTTNYSSFAYPELNQHLLRADPFTADKFYLKFTHAPNLLYISTDGGQTWQGQANANLPDWAWTGQLVVNSKVQNDLWYADGWAGSSPHGVFHSVDGGQTFQQLPGISHAITIAVGAGSGQTGDAAYTVYFYGLLTSSPAWGIFQSTNGGSSWNRISYYPTGLYDVPRAMAASQDTFGKVYVGFSGNSFVYGQIAPVSSTIPAAPAGLTATAVSGSEINLTWTAPPGTVTGYNVYRGTTSGGESTTPVATGLAIASYADMNVAPGTSYYYTVAATNSAGTGPASAEASAAVPTAPSAPTGLTAVAKSSTEIDLSWTAPSGLVSSYNVFRGTSPGGESATPVASGLTSVTYADTSVVAGTQYYYEVSAANVAGAGPDSNEASATALQPSLAIGPAAGSSTSVTVTPGQTATFQLVLTTTNYSGTITFSCTGAPAGDTCSMPSPVNITPATGPTAVSVSVQTGASASLGKLMSHGLLALAAGFLILPIRLRANRRAMIALALAAFTMLGAANGCGSGSGGSNSNNSTSPVVSTLTVSASGPGVTTATQTLTLTVQ
jgi:hypothetical protein